MKKLITLLSISSLLLFACGNEETNESEAVQSEEPSENTEEPSQEELNQEMKEEATEVDFVTANAGEYDEQERLYAEGEVSSLTQDIMDTFILTTEEDGGFGMYSVTTFNTTDAEYEEGDMVRVYGTYKEDSDTAYPTLSATIIEPIE